MAKDDCIGCGGRSTHMNRTHRFGPKAEKVGKEPGWYHRVCLAGQKAPAPLPPDRFTGEPERHVNRDIITRLAHGSRVMPKFVPY